MTTKIGFRHLCSPLMLLMPSHSNRSKRS
ncbi:hypothetical protein NXF25_020298 [Crotalus adamanteus]|uniref:Uncharacterized protein n=1 Tax=Crotalus adamanteus TaxID=8729 RepID=A0AAW1B548_CROAD